MKLFLCGGEYLYFKKEIQNKMQLSVFEVAMKIECNFAAFKRNYRENNHNENSQNTIKPASVHLVACLNFHEMVVLLN